MSYNPNIPQPGDLLSDSQQDILNNFSSANTIFGVDHYAFNSSPNAGKHNTVTTPLIVGAAHPVTAANEPKFYAMQDTANLGVLQYSRGGNNAVPCVVTMLQSPAAAIVMANSTTTNLLDFTGIARAIVKVFVADFALNFVGTTGPKNESLVWWNGTNFNIPSQPLLPPSTRLQVQASGNILQLINNTGVTLSNVYWMMQIYRVQV